MPPKAAVYSMEFASFTCVLVVDTTLERDFELTKGHIVEAKRKIEASTVRSFSITEFDSNLDATVLLATRAMPKPKAAAPKPVALRLYLWFLAFCRAAGTHVRRLFEPRRLFPFVACLFKRPLRPAAEPNAPNHESATLR
jgi:hypothetical protein